MTAALILFAIAAGILAAIVTFAILSRINGGIEEIEQPETLGEQVDVRAILAKYGD